MVRRGSRNFMTLVKTHSSLETEEFGKSWAAKLQPGAVLGLVGNLGGGKTCFVQGLAKGLNVPKNICISSPTYVLLHEYLGGRLPLYHFDFYRLKSQEEAIQLGLADYLDGEGICVIEWADRFKELLPERTQILKFEVLGEGEREIQCLSYKNLVEHP